MEEQALSVALEDLRKSQCTTILDLESGEAKTNLFFLVASLSLLSLRTLRTKARGELYIFVAHEIASTFGFPFIGEIHYPPTTLLLLFPANSHHFHFLNL
jgi:3,4-dihydroxy-2-butanone 4-phosphate synthase